MFNSRFLDRQIDLVERELRRVLRNHKDKLTVEHIQQYRALLDRALDEESQVRAMGYLDDAYCIMHSLRTEPFDHTARSSRKLKNHFAHIFGE